MRAGVHLRMGGASQSPLIAPLQNAYKVFMTQLVTASPQLGKDVTGATMVAIALPQTTVRVLKAGQVTIA